MLNVRECKRLVYNLRLTNTFESSKMCLGPDIKVCAEIASKIIILPNEMLLSFSTGTFLTSRAECLICAITLHFTKANKNECEISQWRLLTKLTGRAPKILL